ncbi:glycerol kinase GlpK [Sphingomonas oligoaromativorans]|uniref:glycerol kinase GlpK n=1 Tax=Sphingomonas oligoaromativorans TaxID=575322 RepID=UPI00141E6A47|nr:glycerol kinase GlpK [Sphingomonas oligoaromativorans]NIJ32733.1 glycerol kinase [Sphingomonas oligoaromativorans]
MTDQIILSIDQGTTSTRSMAFGADGLPRRTARREFPQYYPAPGWVEHDPEDIWRDTVDTLKEAADCGGDVAAIGITNQRETVVLWDRKTGEALHKAIVWQDRRTAGLCARLKADGCEPMVRARTGLLLDPYFSGTKLAWMLDNVEGARARAEKGELAFGTIDSFLLWRLTGGKVHATDASNASRTLLYDIHRNQWDDELLRMLDIPAALLPEVKDNSTLFGETEKSLLGRAIPIGGMAGDQQAAVVGQACFRPGDAKSTYGTGCFLLLNTGEEAVTSQNGMLTTIAYRLGGRTTYALEGSIFVAGAAVKWLRDGLGLINRASDTNDLATRLDGNNGVYMVPAFVGLGAPHWDPNARGTITGLTLDATGAHLARAALESVAYQTADLVDAMVSDGASSARTIRVDGGMAANDWFCQFLADMLDADVERPANIETTAAGAAFLAGLAVGVWKGPEDIAAAWQRDRLFRPQMGADAREGLKAGWADALARSRSTRECRA